jgi:hypothetical protein
MVLRAAVNGYVVTAGSGTSGSGRNIPENEVVTLILDYRADPNAGLLFVSCKKDPHDILTEVTEAPLFEDSDGEGEDAATISTLSPTPPGMFLVAKDVPANCVPFVSVLGVEVEVLSARIDSGAMVKSAGKRA